ncbi:MAG: Uma2 family endonuclease [Gemmatimonadota bacterium]
MQKPITLEEYSALPDDDWYIDEVSYGRLVREPRPGSQHGQIVTMVAHLLCMYVDDHPIGRVYTESGFVLNRTPLVLRGPDVAFVRAERVPAENKPGFFDGAPDLAIEVVSPPNRSGELLQKIGEFLEAGTQLAWIVYPTTRTVAEHSAKGEPRMYGPDEVLTAPALLPGFELKVARLFE